ncbi:MAG: hypothetical protein AB8B93_09715 [Pseudomonadales bacterium]
MAPNTHKFPKAITAQILEESMQYPAQKSKSGAMLALALGLALIPFAHAETGRVHITNNHIAPPNSPKYQAIGQCVRAVQQYWSSDAKLMLNTRATVREEDGARSLLVDGWVWQQGQRVEKRHHCRIDPATQQVALRIANVQPNQLASR